MKMKIELSNKFPKEETPPPQDFTEGEAKPLAKPLSTTDEADSRVNNLH